MIGRAEMIDDTRLCTDAGTGDEALTAMHAANVTAGPVYTIADAASGHFRLTFAPEP